MIISIPFLMWIWLAPLTPADTIASLAFYNNNNVIIIIIITITITIITIITIIINNSNMMSSPFQGMFSLKNSFS